MKLNKTKCELITNNKNARIVLPDNSPVKKHRSAMYLGCEIGIKTTTREEISKISGINQERSIDKLY